MSKNNFISQSKQVEKWLNKIAKAEAHYRDYHKLFSDIRKYYRNETKADKQNIFWSSVETLKPFLYFKQPKSYIERKDKSSDKVQNLACRILERALSWDLEQFDFDSVIKYARNDFLLGGTGIVIERYRPSFGLVEEADGSSFELKIDEKVTTEYIDPITFIADSDKIGIWEDCTFVALKKYFSTSEVIENFGEDIKAFLINDGEDTKSIEVYEIWDKKSEKLLYLSKSCPTRFLKVIDGGLGLSGFYPLPKPLFATLANDSIIPVPDYVQIKPLLDELDGVTTRMEKTMKAIKISGCYDNAFPELANILNKDITLVSISDFDRLKSAGGIKNIVDFMPIDQYITALQSLAQRREDIINAIYEITGVSDIMRGQSNANDTATAITKKANFGTLRNQDRQNDMQRFIADIFKIKAEIICEHFDADKLLAFLPPKERITPEALAAVELLRTEKLRGMILGIESDVTFSESDSNAKNMDAIKTIHTLIGQAFDIVSKQPALLDLYRQMISSIVAGMSNARQYDSVLNSCFDKISAELLAPDEPKPEQPNTSLLALELEREKNTLDYQIKKEQNDIKKAELLFKQQQETSKNLLTNKEMELQTALKMQDKDSSIGTGLVKNFE